MLADKGQLPAPARQRRKVGARDVDCSQASPQERRRRLLVCRAKRLPNGLRNRRPEALKRQRQTARADALHARRGGSREELIPSGRGQRRRDEVNVPQPQQVHAILVMATR